MRNDKANKYTEVTTAITTYENAEAYTKLGWKIVSIRKVLLKGLNKEILECSLLWDVDDSPIYPQI